MKTKITYSYTIEDIIAVMRMKAFDSAEHYSKGKFRCEQTPKEIGKYGLIIELELKD